MRIPLILLLAFSLQLSALQAQVTLENCQQWTREHYPLLRQQALHDASLQLRLEQLDKQRLPQFAALAKANLQSEAIKVPFSAPGQEPIELPLYGLQAYGEATYTIYDGGVIKATKALENQQYQVSRQALEVDLYQLRQQVNQLYLGILQMRAQDSLLQYARHTLESRLDAVEAGVRHGIALPTEADRIRVELLRIDANREEAKGREKSLLATLNAYTGKELDENTTLQPLQIRLTSFQTPTQRPELQLFDLQKQQLLAQSPLIHAKTKPKVNAFIQAGLGYPNPLNFFDTEVSPYGIAGLQLRWNFWDWGQSKKELEVLSVKSQLIDNQKQTFEFNVRLQDGRFSEEAAKLANLIANDRKIADLQHNILQQVQAQLEHGTATAADYIAQLNAELQARLSLRLHELQLQQLYVDYLNLSGQPLPSSR